MDARTDSSAAPPLAHRERLWIVIGVLLPLFLGSLDNTILASALPTIGRDLGDTNNLSWLMTAYLLAGTASMPLYGKIADIHGRMITLRIAIAAYMAGSLVCALAPNMLVLILARGLQGIGGGGMGSMAIVVLGDVAAPKDRGRYYTYFSITYTTAGACGPALGGFLADHLHWSWIFWISIPLGAAAWAIADAMMKKLPRHERPHRLDVLGALLIVVASVSFMLALSLAGVRYAWTSLPVLTLLAIALVVGGLFIVRMFTAPEPLIPLSVLRDPTVRCTAAAHGFGWAAILSLNVFLPMYLQSVMGLSPTGSGLSLMVLMAALNFSAGFAGVVLCRVQHYKRLPMAAYFIALCAMLTMALWVGDMSLWTFEILLLLVAAGFGPMPSLMMVAMQNVVPRHQLGIGVATTIFSRNLCSTMLIAILGTVMLASTSAVGPGALVANGAAGALASPNVIAAFRRVFFLVAASMAAAYVAVLVLEERQLRTDLPEGA